jgi:hypothetical protein
VRYPERETGFRRRSRHRTLPQLSLGACLPLPPPVKSTCPAPLQKREVDFSENTCEILSVPGGLYWVAMPRQFE